MWSCSSCRLLWRCRVHSIGESVLQIHLVSKQEVKDPSCVSQETGEMLVTQNRTGCLMTWGIDWEGMTMYQLGRVYAPPEGEEYFTFTNMCVVETVSHAYAVYPVGEDVIRISCCRCGHEHCKIAGNDGQGRRGMVTALSGVAFGDGMVVVLGYEDGSVVGYRGVGGDEKHVSILFENKAHTRNPCVSLDVHPDERGIHVVAGYAGDSMGEDTEEKHAPLIELGHVDVEQAQYSTTSLLFATTKQNGTLRGMDQVVFREDGKYVAAACWDGKVRIYRVSTGCLVDVVIHHKDAATFVLFFDSIQSRIDGPRTTNRIAIGSRDGTVSLWSMKSSPR